MTLLIGKSNFKGNIGIQYFLCRPIGSGSNILNFGKEHKLVLLLQLEEEEDKDDIDRDPWKDSKRTNPPVSPTPGGYPSPRRRRKLLFLLQKKRSFLTLLRTDSECQKAQISE